MATDLQIPYEKQALTANGGANGILTVASTALFRKGAVVLLSDGTLSVKLVIDLIIDATHIAVRDPSKIGALRYDASAYLVANSAAVYQPEQTDYYNNDWIRF